MTEIVEKDKNVSIEYTLKLEDESVVDTNVGKEPLVYRHGTSQIIKGLEKALAGMKVGETKQVTINPEEGYGSIQKQAIVEVEKGQVPPGALTLGSRVQGTGPDGNVVVARVSEIKEKKVVLDFNHPLAGQTLYFDVRVTDIQAA